MKPFVVPFFLSHQGCPHRCVYCDQHLAGGRRPERLDAEAVDRGICLALRSPRRRPDSRVEVAFFGGTFTLLPRDRQTELLSAVRPHRERGAVHGIRLSTRPDALDEDEIRFLRVHGVDTVEIGAQTMDDRVLEAAGRGHTALQTREAAVRVKGAGIRLGLQLLPGLPGEDDESRERTLAEVLHLTPDDARIYPLLVLRGTPLADLYRQGRYTPLSVDRAVSLCAGMCGPLTRIGTHIIRLGLQTSPELAAGVLAGPYHPAFGDLVRSEVYRLAVARALALNPPTSDEAVIGVAPEDMSQAVGHGHRNINRLAQASGIRGLRFVADVAVSRGRFRWQGREYGINEE